MIMRKLIEHNTKIEELLISYLMPLALFAYFVLKFVEWGIPNLFYINIRWQTYELFINYSHGFVTRAFLGTIVRFLTEATGAGYKQVILVFSNIEEFLFIGVLLSVLLYAVIRYKDGRLNMLIMMFISTNFLGYYIFDWGEPDVMMMTLTIIMCILIVNDKLLWLIPLLSSVCICIHEGYPLMYFGIVIALLFVRYSGASDKKMRSRYMTVLMTTGGIALILFIYFYFFSYRLWRITPEELISEIENTLVVGEFAVMNIHYALFHNGIPCCAMWVDGHITKEFWPRILSVIFTGIFMLPLLIMKVKMWATVIKGESDRIKKLAYLFCSLLFVLTLPLIIVHTDQGRWVYDLVFQDFAIVIFLYIMSDGNIKKAMNKTVNCSVLSLLYSVLLCVIFHQPNVQFVDFLCSDCADFILNLVAS